MRSRIASVSGITARAVRSTATVTVAATQNNNDTVVINGTTLTWKTTVTDATTQIDIGADDLEGAANLATTCAANSTLAALITTSVASAVVTLQAIVYGTAGDAYTLAEAGTSSTISGAVFTNGVNPIIAEESGKTHIITGYQLALDGAGEITFYTGNTALMGAMEVLADSPFGLADSDGLFACATGEPFSFVATAAGNGWIAYRTVSG